MITEGVPALDKTVSMVQQALSGLGHAHDHKVVHRDIKPANLMLDTHGTVKVLDFGIAHIVGESTLTGTGMMLGTPGYMAPEQVLGHKVDRRTDLYAMGIVLYQMLTGKLPFVGNSQFEAQQAHFQERPKELELLSGKVPPALHDAVLHAIAKDGDDRFQTASEFSSALGETLNGISSAAPTKLRTNAETVVRHPTTGEKLQPGETLAKTGGGKGKLIAAGAAAALALAAGAAYFLKPAVTAPTTANVPKPTSTAPVSEGTSNPEAETASELIESKVVAAEPKSTASGSVAAGSVAAGSAPATSATRSPVESVPSNSMANTTAGVAGSSAGGAASATKASSTGSAPAAATGGPSTSVATPVAAVTSEKALPGAAGAVAASLPASQPAPVVPSGPPTVAVVDFTASSSTPYRASLAELVVDELVNRSKFDVLEREKLNSLMGELSFQNESGFVSPASAVQMGNMLGARLLVTGHVIDHGSSKQNYSGYGITTTKITNRLKARLEVIDLSTGSKLFSRVSQASKETQVVQGSRADSGQKDLGSRVAKQLVTAMLAAPRLKEMVEGPALVAIEVNSSPPQADVEVDGTYYGTAGDSIELQPGTHQIKVSLPGYTDWEKRVLVKKGTKAHGAPAKGRRYSH